ncbi:MAG: DUF4197 domain-containing protein [Novosphingobium sp.]|nr:DUF4197 domain-containing protein [Novosphingobium sp.]
MQQTNHFHRRMVLAGLAATAATLPFAGSAHAKVPGLSSILGRASDSALDRLALPGAFYNDEDIRIGLPLIGKIGGKRGGLFGSLFGGARKLNLLDGLTRKLNDAAGVAAGVAKPVFHTAIDDLSFNDVPGIVSNNDGATQYLHQSANDELHGKLRPLVDEGLGDAGAYRELDGLNSKHSYLGLAGIDRNGLGNSVTKQALNGIFKYIGSEEAKLRANPLGKAGGLFKGLIGN